MKTMNKSPVLHYTGIALVNQLMSHVHIIQRLFK